MSADDVASLLAVLAMVGATAGLATVVALAVPSLRSRLLAALASDGTGTGQALPVGWLVALVATLGSLYLSEVAHFTPCRLCWYQRIAMYPLVVVLGVGALRRDRGAHLPAALLAGAGLAVNLWHLAVELWPTIEGDSCDPTNPCSLRWVEAFGFWTIPRMATVGFALVLLALLVDHLSTQEHRTP